VRGTWREGSFTGDPENISKALDVDVCFHRGPPFEEYGETLLS
jgi:hypothetical protein